MNIYIIIIMAKPACTDSIHSHQYKTSLKYINISLVYHQYLINSYQNKHQSTLTTDNVQEVARAEGVCKLPITDSPTRVGNLHIEITGP